MSPRDFALLVVPLQERAAGREMLLAPAGNLLPGSPGAAGPTEVANAASGRSRVVLPTPDANPFLQALNTPPEPPAPPARPAFTNADLPPAAVVAPAAIAVPAPAPADGRSGSKIPDFAKRAEDEKHFKPLKRF